MSFRNIYRLIYLSAPAELRTAVNLLPRRDGPGTVLASTCSADSHKAATREDMFDLVSVVIPAFNAAKTIDHTLNSARNQTYRNLQIIIVDDGSKDATEAIVRSHAAADPRVMLISQANSGVAAARNAGITACAGHFVALLDADDIWTPDKIEMQMELISQDQTCGLVYTWFATIDEDDRVIGLHMPEHAGRVVEDFCRGNFVGNASSALIRKSALLAGGLFDPKLRAANAQGCEDYLLFVRIAETFEFNVVRRFSTGYRQTSSNMSSNLRSMYSSYLAVHDEILFTHAEYQGLLAEAKTFSQIWLLQKALSAGQVREISYFGRLLLRQNPVTVMKQLLYSARRIALKPKPKKDATFFEL